MKIIKSCSLCLLFVLSLTFVLTSRVYAQGFELHFEADSDVLAVDDRVVFTLTASNTGSTNLLDVTAEVLLPEFIDTFTDNEEFNCPNNCDDTEIAVWTIGTLAPGQSRTFFFRTFIQGNAPEGMISGKATVSLPGVSDIVETVEILIDNSREMRVNVSPESGPAEPGEPFTYTMTVSNLGATSIVSPVLELQLPDGASFVSATDGGVEQSGVVSWALGVFGAGAGRQIQVTVLPDAGLSDGALLVASASLNPNKTNEATVKSVDVSPVRANVPLRFEYGINQTAHGVDDRFVYELTATNTGVTALLDVTAEVLLPEFIDTFTDDLEFDCPNNCDDNEIPLWTIGTLEPGQTRTVFFHSFVSGNAPAGHILKSKLVGTSTGSGQVFASFDAHVDPSPRMRLNVSPESGPAQAGVPFVYTLTVSNIGATSVVNPGLAFLVPENVSFVSATDSGVEQDGVVSWDLGGFGIGEGRQIQVTLLPDAGLSDGSLLVARASVNPNETNEATVRSVTVTPVRADVPLHIEYGINRTAPGADDQLVYELTATNTGATALLDVTAEVLLPEFIDTFTDDVEFNCPNNCDDNEVAVWTIGTLEPGQSRTVFFRTFVFGNAPAGHLLMSRLLGTSTGSGQVLASLDAHVDPSPRMRLSASPAQSPAVAGELLTYTMTIGNIGVANPGDFQLAFELPAGVTLASASDNGVENNGIVSWDFAPLMAGHGRKVELAVMVDNGLAAGNQLVARVSLIPNELNESILRTISVVPVGALASVNLDYTPNLPAYNLGDQIMFTLNATNTGQTDILDLTVDTTLPLFINTFPETTDFDCPNNCDSNEVGIWLIGTLSPGQTRTQDIITKVSSSAMVGEIMNTRFEIQPNGQEQVFVFRDELIGVLDVSNIEPSKPGIVRLPDGTSLTVGGTNASDAGDPAMLLNVAWTASVDPEDDPLTYTWELATDAGFTNIIFSKMSEAGLPTQVDVSFNTLASLLDAEGVAPGASLQLYHRVVVSDGTHRVESAAFTINLTRGTLVGAEEEAGLPSSFKLHANYPNPFNPVTSISFDVPEAGPVRIDLFNAQGRLVSTLVNGDRAVGSHVVRVDLQGEPSGVYFYRLRAGALELVRQMTLLK